MKKMLIGLILISCMAFTGCSAPYTVYLKDGTIIETTCKPSFDEDTGFYKCKAANGKKVQINKNEVLKMQEK